VSRRQIAVRLGALVLVSLIGVFFITVDVVGYRLGAQPFQVTVDLPRGGGLYADGFVTYRGVDVGRIDSLSLTPGGAVAVLDIDPGTHIPANATAHVHELSVAGEQYLDLVPRSGGGPDLHAGSVIGRSNTVVPVSVYTLLDNAGQLIASIKSSEVRTITTALGAGFSGTGSDLRAIEVAGRNLVSALQAAQAATVVIINGGGDILSAARASDHALIALSQSLQQITAQVAASNADVAAVLAQGAPTEQAIHTVITQDGDALSALIKNLAALSDVAIAHQPAVQALLDQLPTFVSKIARSASSGSVAVHIYYNSKNTVCPYVAGAQTAEPTATTPSAALNRTCGVTAPDLNQRGAANVPVSSGG
jgi:phospholipid/cholesterol/gamma-HCH transport system substrate-binding protein